MSNELYRAKSMSNELCRAKSMSNELYRAKSMSNELYMWKYHQWITCILTFFSFNFHSSPQRYVLWLASSLSSLFISSTQWCTTESTTKNGNSPFWLVYSVVFCALTGMTRVLSVFCFHFVYAVVYHWVDESKWKESILTRLLSGISCTHWHDSCPLFLVFPFRLCSGVHIPMRRRVKMQRVHFDSSAYWYGVATISRMLKNIGLFCKRALQKRPIFCKETYIFKHPTHRSHPIFSLLIV